MNSLLAFMTAHRTKFFVVLVLAASGFLLLWQEPQKPLRVAVAKGGRMLEMSAILESAANQGALRGLVLDDVRVSILLDDKDYGFLYAYPLRNTIESENVKTYLCSYDGEILFDSVEITDARFWSTKEIEKNLGKDLFTPNFEEEFKYYKDHLKK